MNKNNVNISKKTLQSITAAVCAWAILLGLVAPGMAAETEVPAIQESVLLETTAKTTAEAVTEENNSGTTQYLLATLRGEIAEYMEIYQISPEMPDSALANAYFALDSAEAKAAWDTAHTLMEKAAELSDEDTAALMADINTKLCLRFYDIIKQINAPMPTAYNQLYAAENLSIAVAGADNETYYSSSQAADNSVTATVKTHTTKDTCNNTVYNPHMVSVTVTNNSSKRAILGFQWTVTPCQAGHDVAITINGATAAGSNGSYSTGTYINASAEVIVTLKSCSKCTANSTLVLSEFSYEPEADKSKVTFVYDSSLGSITVAGNAVNSGHVEEVTPAGVAVTATANAGVTFLGWINEESYRRYSANTTDTLKPGTDATIRAVFTKSDSTQGWYLAGKTHLFSDLNKAAEYAKSSVDSLVVLMNNATLPAGNYTIPAGVTFAIPFDDTNTYYVEKPVAEPYIPENPAAPAPVPAPTAYRTLTMADGAKLTVNGTMSVPAKVYAGSSGGVATMPKEQYAHVFMNSGSSITVNGTLSTFGYITGSGSVSAMSGSKVYESFQVMDFRGGTATFNMAGGLGALLNPGNEGDVLPLSQYYVQNIEVPLTIYSGASEVAFIALYMQETPVTSSVAYIGKSGCMFNLTSGYVTKKYDKSSDRLFVDIYGDLSIDSFSLDIKMIIDISINSKDYILPITNSMTVNLNSGTVNINADMALLPGAQINIGTGTTVKLASKKRFFVYDLLDWAGKGFVYNASDLKAAYYVPNRIKTRTSDDLFDATIHVSGTLDTAEGYLYTTESGASITGTEGGKIKLKTDGSQNIVKQANQGGESGTDITYIDIPATAAQLLNANGEYIKTAEKGAGTYTYINGFWHKGGVCVGGTATCTQKAVCTICNQEYGELAAHSFENGICSVCGQYMRVEIVATNIAVNDGLDMWFYVKAENVDNDSYKAVVTKQFADDRSPNPITVTIPSGQWEPYTDTSDGTQYLRFPFSDISAKEMTDNVDAIICHTDGTQVSNAYSQTVQNYAITTLEGYKTNNSAKAEALKYALMDMLEYGASAQMQFNYNTSLPANVHTKLADFNSYITTTTPACASQKNYGNNVAGVTVSATNTLMFTFYFKVANPDGMYAIIKYTPSGETTEQTVTVQSEDFYERVAGSLYGVDVTGLSIVDGRALMTCTLYNSDGTVVTSATDSIEGYAYRNAEKGEIFMDMMRFVDSAFAYFTT